MSVFFLCIDMDSSSFGKKDSFFVTSKVCTSFPRKILISMKLDDDALKIKASFIQGWFIQVGPRRIARF